MLSYIVWNADPVVFSLGSLSVRWYGLLYALGFYFGITLLGKMFKKDGAPDKWVDTIFIYMLVAVIVGARLGHVFFYGWEYYKNNIPEIFMIWHGGLASHGGAIGMIIAVYVFSKVVAKGKFWWVADRLFVPSALVAGMIRVGNLMNSEIYGTPTDLPWGFIFLRGQEYLGVPCHPTQIYEALAYFSLFIFMMWLYWKRDAGKYPGLLAGVGFTGVFTARLFIEIIKNNQEAFEANMLLNMGQLLSVPFIIFGVTLIIWSLRSKHKTEKS